MKRLRSASADTPGSLLCQDCLAAVASRLETTRTGEVCLHEDRLLSRPPPGSLRASDRLVCLLAQVQMCWAGFAAKRDADNKVTASFE